MIKHKLLRLLLAIAVEWAWEVYQMDIRAAYLKECLKEEIFLEIPDQGILDRRITNVVRLLQSGRKCNLALNEFIISVKLIRSHADPCVYHNVGMGILVGVYVDDLVVVVKNGVLYEFKRQIQAEFDAKELEEFAVLLPGHLIEKRIHY